MKLPRWPQSLRGQVITLVLIGLVLAQVLGFIISRLQHERMVQSLRNEYVLARVASVVRLLVETPVEVHAQILHAVSSPPLQLSLAAEPMLEASPERRDSMQWRQWLATLLDTERADIRIGLNVLVPPRERWHPPPPGGQDRRGHGPRGDAPRPAMVLAVAVRLPDGRWLNAVSQARPPPPFWEGSSLLSIGLTALILSGLMILMVRRITRPLAQLAVAADRFGRGEAGPPLAEDGPLDIQETIRAFNHMRERLERFVQDRTRMLAAISHDLRTPITALRVRAELIEDGDTRDKICATLDEMQHMTEATLTFVREDAIQEETRLLDLDALVQSVCDDLSDTGKDVTFCGPGQTPYRCRALGLKRALRNLVENAVIYGQCARVTLTAARDTWDIMIDDDGPGIAASDVERIFEPFVRLETSRSRDTGGVGLGLAIARTIVRGHGGEIVLVNCPEGGLRATVHMPKDGSRHGNVA